MKYLPRARAAGSLRRTGATGLACLRTLLIWLACAASGGAGAQELAVAAASSLGDALRALGAGFEAAHPGVTLRYSVAASGVLLQQMAEGAPIDVLVSADTEVADSGVRRGLLQAAGRHDIATNQLVLVVPTGSTRVATLADLARPEVQRIALGRAPTVPAGRYARQALDAARLWPTVQRKVVPGDDVRQVLELVARGEADAGFVYATDAAAQADRVHVVPTTLGHGPVRYPAAVASASRLPALARSYIDYLRSAPAQAELARRGFGPP